MTTGIILAGGLSERLVESGTPKQFIKIAGVPLVMYCLRTFERCADMDVLAIVAPEHWRKKLQKWLGEYGIGKFKTFAPPGRTRQHSIYNGLLSVKSPAPRRIVIHDAVRPLVTNQDICNCIRSSEGHDGATPAMPLTETVYQSMDGETISALVNRDRLHSGQTPECYDFAKYLHAHEALSDAELGNIRGSSEIAFMAGMKIHLHKGNPQNLKITTSADLDYFKYIIEARGL